MTRQSRRSPASTSGGWAGVSTAAGKELNDFQRIPLEIEILSNLRFGSLEIRDTSVIPGYEQCLGRDTSVTRVLVAWTDSRTTCRDPSDAMSHLPNLLHCECRPHPGESCVHAVRVQGP